MNANTANSQTMENTNSVEKKILAHAKEKYSLEADKVTLTKSDNTNLPSGAESYYLEEKDSYGNKFYNYVVYKDKIFSSGNDEDFGAFLKEIDFLSKKNLSDKQFWSVFQKLRFPYRSATLVEEEQIKNPSSTLKPVVGKVALPKLDVNAQGARYDFYIIDSNQDMVRKYTLSISPDYKTKLDFSTVE